MAVDPLANNMNGDINFTVGADNADDIEEQTIHDEVINCLKLFLFLNYSLYKVPLCICSVCLFFFLKKF